MKLIARKWSKKVEWGVQSKIRINESRPVFLCTPWPPQVGFFPALILHLWVKPIALLRTPNWCFHHLLWTRGLWQTAKCYMESYLSTEKIKDSWMQLEYKWLICLVKHSNTLRIFNEIKNKIAPSVCACYFCLHHKKLFIHINQEIQTNTYNHEKRSKYMEVGKSCKICSIILK